MKREERFYEFHVNFAVFAAFAMASSLIAGKVGYYQDAGEVKYVSTPDDNVQGNGAACQDAVGNVYVGWIENSQVYAQKMAASNNSRQWGTNGLVALNDVQLTNPITIDLTFDGTYLWVAVLDQTVTEGDIVQVQRIASNGALLVPSPLRRIVNEKSGDPTAIQDCVRIAADGQGGVVVAVPAVDNDSVYISRLETDGLFTYTPMISTQLPADGCFLKLLQGNAGNMWVASANATDIYVKYYGAGGAGSSELTGGWDWANGTEFWTVPNGSGGIVAVADNDTNTKIYGLDSSGSLYTETTVNGAPTAATALVGAQQYVAFLTDDDNVHKYEIDTGDFAQDANFPVDLTGDNVVNNPQMGDLGGERIGISGYVDGLLGEDLYVQVLSEDGVSFFNDVDDPTPVDANADEEIKENLALFSGSGKAVVLFDDNNTTGDYDDGDTNDNDKDTYLVAPFDFGEAADLRWTNNILANPDVLDTAEANSTLTVDRGIVENAGQVDAEDVKVFFYIANTNEIADANVWNDTVIVKKMKVDEQDIGDLDIGGSYDYGTASYDVNIDQSTVNQILQEIYSDEGNLYLCALVNDGDIIPEESYFVITTDPNHPSYLATNLSCTESPLTIYAPDFRPEAIDNDVSNVAAGDNVTLNDVVIENIGDREGTCNVGFYLSADGDLNGTVDVLNEAELLGSVDGVTIGADYSRDLDPVELVIPYNVVDPVYIYVVPDYDEMVGELVEDNNVDYHQGIGRTNGFGVTGLADLTVPILASTEAEITAASSGGFSVAKVAGVDPGEVIPLRFTVMNIGVVESGITKVKAYFTDNATNLNPDNMVYVDMLPALLADEYKTYITEVTVPEEAAGEYYLVVVADPEGLVPEFDEDNNSAQKTIIVDLLVPSIGAAYDYGNSVVSLDLDLEVAGDYEGQPADLWLTVMAEPFGQMYYYELATGAWYSTPIPLMQTNLTSMAGTIKFSIGLPAGNYYFYFGVDDQNGAVDSDILFDLDTLLVR
jgi:hypothetical protein